MSEPQLQRACACGGTCPTCKTEPDKRVQTKRVDASGGGAGAVPAIINSVVSGSGRPLDTATRSFMEPRFGFDFSGVRIHTDARAAESTREVNALAYTVGRNVVFGAGQYAPQTEAGRHLLAHELTHVIQQRSDDHSGVVHRQPKPPNANPNPNPPPAAANKFSPTPGCIVDKTNTQIPVDTGTVTVIEYGAEWCGGCGIEQKFLVELCNEYKAAKTAAPVRFFLVDQIDDAKKPTDKTWPPLPGSVPAVLVYSGKFETFKALGPTTKVEVKAAIDAAIPCAKDPLKCAPLEEPAGGPGCTIQTAAVPKGNRFKFSANIVDFAPGEEAKLEAFVKKIKPGARVDLLGLASSDGPVATNRVLSCQRALTATRVFARNGILVKSLIGAGPVPATDNKPEFRAVDVTVTDPVIPNKPPQTPTATASCDPATCKPDFAISGPTTVVKPPKFSDPKENTSGDPRQLLQTYNCDPALFQIVYKGTATNIFITHVKWQKDPPAGTLSVQRNARDEKGDDPAPGQRAASFATLNPVVSGTGWDTNVNASGGRQACWTTKQAPSWCVPFCSFGKFTMVATVSWQCGTTICSNDFNTQPLTIDVQKTP